MSLDRLRNIGIVAHIDAGKTTVSERILFYTGVERRMGEVHEGTAVMDWMEEERRRGITITAAATTVPWREHTINLIDTPGHVDFTVEVERCMRVLDGAVLVVNAVAGVQAQSETVWRQMRRHQLGCIAFVNQYDRPGADFFHCVSDMQDKLGADAVPIQYPIGSGRGFRTLVDLISGEALEFPEEEQGRNPRPVEVPAELSDEIGVLRAELIEKLAEGDEEVLACFSEDREAGPELLRKALRRRVIDGSLVPVLCGAALRNVGVQSLLDAVVHYLPCPHEVPPIEGHSLDGSERRVFEPKKDGPACALAFKLAADPHEDLVFTRVYSGTIKSSDKLYNPRQRKQERVARVLQMHAETRTAVPEAGPGDIVALTGLKFTTTGDTLCERGSSFVLEPLVFPEPVISRVVEPRSAEDRDRLRGALERLAFEDPSFLVREDEDTGQWHIAGMGELHLEVKEHLLSEAFGLEVNAGQPRVEYREAITGPGSGSGRVDRVLGGNRVFGSVAIEITPLAGLVPGGAGRPAGQAVPVNSRTQLSWDEENPVPERFREALEESVLMSLQVGPRFGFPMTGCKIRLGAGERSPERETELGFCQAAANALRQALGEAQVTLLEPVMAFDIEAPAEFMSGIIGELNAKKAEIEDLEVDGDMRRVLGEVPLCRMFGYATTLRSLSQGRATFSLTPAGFSPVPEEELEARGLTWQ